MVAAARSAMLQWRLAVLRFVSVCAEGQNRNDRRRANAAAPFGRRREIRRREIEQLVLAVRGNESLRQLQGQRYDGGVYARPYDRGQAGGLRLDRKYERFAGALLRRQQTH